MSVDYRIVINRKCDGKKLGEFGANEIKNVLDSEYSNMIHCDGRTVNDGSVFTVAELENVSNQAFDKLTAIYDKIIEKKLMIALAKNVEIKRQLEEDIEYLKEDIEELKHVTCSANCVIGQITEVVENNIRNGKPAYDYNGKDLPKEIHEYGDGKKYECAKSIWNRDVVCKLIGDY